MRQFPITLEQFEAWAVKKGAGEHGVPCSAKDCPIARCLQETVGGEWKVGKHTSAKVNWYYGYIYTTEDYGYLPHWVKEVIRKVDSIDGLGPISRIKLLTIINEVREKAVA